MREKPLSRIGDELARLRDDVMPERPAPPAGFGIDEALVSRFADGELSGQPEADLAGQVARVLPCHWSQSNAYASLMTQVMDPDGEPRKAVGLARATAAWLREVAPRAGELDHRCADLGEVVERSEKDIEEAAAEL
ncbi:hypothetical protein [Streptomyces koyangensis]|uniref:Uncharacterized protein n=1 Tax=Streptomyces koyangensis TaxID=188770 RepID=A0ABX7EMW1_9ACTN|nr:hypothetical protein [Streptomyces koyangensis]QRF05842.1 hypothetical protein G9U55_29250 [Streptomyces koyangensis]